MLTQASPVPALDHSVTVLTLPIGETLLTPAACTTHPPFPLLTPTQKKENLASAGTMQAPVDVKKNMFITQSAHAWHILHTHFPPQLLRARVRPHLPQKSPEAQNNICQLFCVPVGTRKPTAVRYLTGYNVTLRTEENKIHKIQKILKNKIHKIHKIHKIKFIKFTACHPWEGG